MSKSTYEDKINFIFLKFWKNNCNLCIDARIEK